MITAPAALLLYMASRAPRTEPWSLTSTAACGTNTNARWLVVGYMEWNGSSSSDPTPTDTYRKREEAALCLVSWYLGRQWVGARPGRRRRGCGPGTTWALRSSTPLPPPPRFRGLRWLRSLLLSPSPQRSLRSRTLAAVQVQRTGLWAFRPAPSATQRPSAVSREVAGTRLRVRRDRWRTPGYVLRLDLSSSCTTVSVLAPYIKQ